MASATSPSANASASPSTLRNRKSAFVVRPLGDDGHAALDALLDTAPAAPAAAPTRAVAPSSPAPTQAPAPAAMTPSARTPTPIAAVASSDGYPGATSNVGHQQASVPTAAASTAAASVAPPAAAEVPASSAALAASPGTSVPAAPRRRVRAEGDEGDLGGVLFLFLFAVMLAGGITMYLMSDTLPGGMRGGGRKMHDTTFKLVVSLEAVYSGSIVQSEFPGGRQVVCPHCSGSGGHGPNGVSVCSECEGAGFKQHRRQIAPGFFQSYQQQCTACGGRGSHITHACHECGGHGLLRDSTTPLQVRIPAGAPEGWTIHMRHAGDQPPPREKGVESGDVLVSVSTRPHPRFERHGPHLHAKHTLTLRQALLGFTYQLQLLDGSFFTIARSKPTSPGEVLKLEGRGLPAFDEAAAKRVAKEDSASSATGLINLFTTRVMGPIERAVDAATTAVASVLSVKTRPHDPNSRDTPRGDLLVEFVVQLPKRLSEEEKKMLQALLKD